MLDKYIGLVESRLHIGMSKQIDSAQKIFESGSRTFFEAAKFFPPQVRKDITILYAFVRIADELVDIQPQKILEFEVFCAQVAQARRGEATSNSFIQAFVEMEAKYNFPPQWIDAFLNSMRADITKHNYKNFQELEDYCYGSASVIGLFICAILRTDPAAYPYAKKLGTAFQLINVIRDAWEDYKELGRVYIPQNEIEAAEMTDISHIQALLHPNKFKNLISFQIERYQKLQKEGLEGLRFLPRNVRSAIQTAADMYDWTGKQILKNPFIIYRKKVRPNKTKIILTGSKNALLSYFYQN